MLGHKTAEAKRVLGKNVAEKTGDARLYLISPCARSVPDTAQIPLQPFEMFMRCRRGERSLSQGKTGWLCAQSTANPSHVEFPVKQGKYREIILFSAFPAF